MELSHNKAQIHVDHGVKTYIGTKKDINQKAAEKSYQQPRLISLYKCS